MTKKAVRATVSNTKAAVGLHKSGSDEDGTEHLRYAEFVHLMRTGVLNTRFPGHDWRSGAKQLHNYRKAFDTADVDGDDIIVENAPTAYGTLHYRVQCELEGKRRITVSMHLDSRKPVAVRVYANPINLGNLLMAKWSHARDTARGLNWTQGEVKGKAEVQLQF